MVNQSQPLSVPSRKGVLAFLFANYCPSWKVWISNTIKRRGAMKIAGIAVLAAVTLAPQMPVVVGAFECPKHFK